MFTIRMQKADPHNSLDWDILPCPKAMWIGFDSKTISVYSPNGIIYVIQLSHPNDVLSLYQRFKNLSRFASWENFSSDDSFDLA